MITYHLDLSAETFMFLFAVCVLLPALPTALIHWKLQPIPVLAWSVVIGLSCLAGLFLCVEIWLSKITVSGRHIEIDGWRYRTAGEIRTHGVSAVSGTLQDHHLYRRNGLDLYSSKKGHYVLADGPVYLAAGSGALYQLLLTDGRRIWLSVPAAQETAWMTWLNQQELLSPAVGSDKQN